MSISCFLGLISGLRFVFLARGSCRAEGRTSGKRERGKWVIGLKGGMRRRAVTQSEERKKAKAGGKMAAGRGRVFSK